MVIRVEEKEQQVLLSVRDTGFGIPAEDLPKIFDQFFRSQHSAQRITGSGLGLAIVKSLVEMHGGTVQVESTIDEGSLFVIRLPVT